ncbi:hypothetical protein CTI14_50990, partial [Methylobacterium radiotolerans]
RANVNRGNNVDQVMQNNKVFGGRFTIDTPLSASAIRRSRGGADFIQGTQRDAPGLFDPALSTKARPAIPPHRPRIPICPWTTTRSVGIFTRQRQPRQQRRPGHAKQQGLRRPVHHRHSVVRL